MDIQTFEAEVLKIERLLYHISWSMLFENEDCADAVQETLTRAWKNRHSLRNIKAFRSWMVQILQNVCNDMLNRRQKQRSVPLEDDVPATLASETGGESMDEILQSLSPELRTIVVLHYFEGYKVREIAKMLNLPVGTVKSRLGKARTCLRKEVDLEAGLYGGMKYEKV